MKSTKAKCIFISTGKRTFSIPVHFRALDEELAGRGYKAHLLIHHHHPVDLQQGVDISEYYYWPWRTGMGRIKDFFMLLRFVMRYKPSCVIAGHRETKMLILVGFLAGVPVRILWYHTLGTQIEFLGRKALKTARS